MAAVTWVVLEVPTYLPEDAKRELLFHASHAAGDWADQFDWEPAVFLITSEEEEAIKLIRKARNELEKL